MKNVKNDLVTMTSNQMTIQNNSLASNMFTTIKIILLSSCLTINSIGCVSEVFTRLSHISARKHLPLMTGEYLLEIRLYLFHNVDYWVTSFGPLLIDERLPIVAGVERLLSSLP